MKRDVKLASAIMLFALIGLLSFQAYWINSIYQDNKFNFETDAQAALNSANQSLLIKKLGLLGGLKVDVSDASSISITMGDDESFGISSTFGFDMMSPRHFMRRDSVRDSDILYLKGSVMSQSFITDTDKILPIMSDFHTKISDMDFELLDSLVAENLQIKGLNNNYFLGVWDEGHDRFAHTNRFVEDSSAEREGFSVKTFSFGNPQSNELRLDFPRGERLKASFAGIGPVVGASILMLVLLISAWYYIVRSLQKQYRLAQIKDDFIGNMTHELKTPVTASSIALEVMRKNKKVKEDDKLKDLVGIAESEQKRILQIVNSILDNTSAEKPITKNVEIVDLGEELDVIVESMRLSVEERGGKIALDLPSNSPHVMVNRMHFQNALLNILDNAIKYANSTPLIDVVLNASPIEAEIRLSDQGIGISREDRKRIFDKFFRVHTGNVHTVKGYGLGLSYTKSVIDQLGGTISVQSEEGQGSTFIIKIPIVTDES